MAALLRPPARTNCARRCNAISFTNAPRIRQRGNVRPFYILICALLASSTALGQDQERKLVDRLLNPDMSLANPAQKKKFTTDRKAAEKPANVGTFYFEQKPAPRNYSGTREFTADEFRSRGFVAGQKTANTSTRTEIQNAAASPATPPARAVRETRDARKIVASRNYAGERPFLERGKSQKSLDRQNPPMTIDDVRELLNKNK